VLPYPSRDQFFAHKFVRLLHKAAVAADIGRDAFSLLVVIAHTEDAMRYRGAAKFWNSQLIETLGFTKWDQFDKARRKAIESGWLSYSGDGKRTSGEYFVTVPDGYEQISDSPIESMCTLVNPENGYDQGYKEGYKQGMIEGTNRVQCGVQTGYEQGEPSNPIPLPIPIPIPLPEEGKETQTADAAAPATEIMQEVLEEFDASFGTRSRLTVSRIKALKARLKDSWWCDNWRAALDRGSGSAFLRGANERGWKIDFEFFLRPDTATKILEGKYSNGKPQQRKTSAEQREELNSNSFDWIRQAASEAAGGGCEGLSVPSGTGATLFLEEHGTADGTRC
jgi:hypothetical protein